MLGKVGNTKDTPKTADSGNEQKNKALNNYTAQVSDTPEKLYKLFNFKTEKDFRKYIGISGTAQLKKGTSIKVPTIGIETTFAAISRQYNMSIAELKTLNPQIKDFNNIQKDTPINVPVAPFKKDKPNTPKEGSLPAKKIVSAENDISPVMTLAQDLKKASNKTAAIEKNEFTEPFGKINKDIVENVIKAYDKISPNESLINMISSEWGSSKTSRKDAVMDIFNKLAEKKGAGTVTDEIRKEFEDELQKQFNSFGFVSTKKLDKIINDIIDKPASSAKSTKKDTSRKVFLGNGTVHTADKLKKDAENSGKKDIQSKFEAFQYAEAIRIFAKKQGKDINNLKVNLNNINSTKAFCEKNKLSIKTIELDISRVRRPQPVIDENGKIVTDISPLMKPTVNKGELKGKVFLINPGHGGFQSENGAFDPGAVSFAKDASGKYVPVEEFAVVSRYADDMIEKLRAKGASVVRIQGTVNTMAKTGAIQNLVKKYEKEFGSENCMLISLHADSEPAKSGSGVLFNPHDNKDTILSYHMADKLNEESWVKADTSERPYKLKDGKEKGNLYILTSSKNIASNLIEIEYLSGTRSANLNSSAYQTRFVNAAMNGVISYFNNKE